MVLRCLQATVTFLCVPLFDCHRTKFPLAALLAAALAVKGTRLGLVSF